MIYPLLPFPTTSRDA